MPTYAEDGERIYSFIIISFGEIILLTCYDWF